eukprot:scaffold395646_cov18-Prasinocladus_malaysianus.AAC.1
MCEQRTESVLRIPAVTHIYQNGGRLATVGFHGFRIHQTTSQPHNEARGPPPGCSTARQQVSRKRTGGAMTALLLLG